MTSTSNSGTPNHYVAFPFVTNRTDTVKNYFLIEVPEYHTHYFFLEFLFLNQLIMKTFFCQDLIITVWLNYFILKIPYTSRIIFNKIWWAHHFWYELSISSFYRKQKTQKNWMRHNFYYNTYYSQQLRIKKVKTKHFKYVHEWKVPWWRFCKVSFLLLWQNN